MQGLGRGSTAAHSQERRVRRGHVKNQFGEIAGLAVDTGILNLSVNNSHKLILLVHGRESGRKCICTVRVLVESGERLFLDGSGVILYAGRSLHFRGFRDFLRGGGAGFFHFVVEHGLRNKLQLIPLGQAVDGFVRNARVLHVFVDFRSVRFAVIAVPNKGTDFRLNGLILSGEGLLIFLRPFGFYGLRRLPDTGAERLYSVRSLLRFPRHSDVLSRVLFAQGLPVDTGVLSIDDCLYELICLSEQGSRGVDLIVTVRALLKDGLPLLRHGLRVGFRQGMHGRTGIRGKFAPGISAEPFRHGGFGRLSRGGRLPLPFSFPVLSGVIGLFARLGFVLITGIIAGGFVARVQRGNNVFHAIQCGRFSWSRGSGVINGRIHGLIFVRHNLTST
nr:MAG TPA: hypothetical protein [Caudoviricetes sp.]